VIFNTLYFHETQELFKFCRPMPNSQVYLITVKIENCAYYFQIFAFPIHHKFYIYDERTFLYFSENIHGMFRCHCDNGYQLDSTGGNKKMLQLHVIPDNFAKLKLCMVYVF